MVQLGPKMTQAEPKMAPRWPQDDPRMGPSCQMAPRWPQDGPKMAPRLPKTLSKPLNTLRKTLFFGFGCISTLGWPKTVAGWPESPPR